MSEILNKHRETWHQKKILRLIYTDWYRQILGELKQGNGKSVELGAGTGNFKDFKPDVIAADIEPCDWLDLCFDAHQMPFENNSIANIIMIDVFHHLANPILFLEEAYRTLEPGGRILMLEPYPSTFSLSIYRKFHPEPFIFNANFFAKKDLDDKDPWDSNQAAAYLVFYRNADEFANRFKGKLWVRKKKLLSCILYPLSGGFEHKSLIPDSLIPLFRFAEWLLFPFIKWLAFRTFIVIEKNID